MELGSLRRRHAANEAVGGNDSPSGENEDVPNTMQIYSHLTTFFCNYYAMNAEKQHMMCRIFSPASPLPDLKIGFRHVVR